MTSLLERAPSESKAEPLHKPRRSVIGLLAKFLLLGSVDAIAMFAVYVLLARGSWIAALLVVIPVLGINYVYLTSRAMPLKYLLPGTVAMVIFSLLPIVYTVFIAFTNYSTGHVGSKDDAISRITEDGYIELGDYALRIVTDPAGETVYALATIDPESGEVSASYIGTREGLTELPAPLVLNSDTFEIEPPAGYTALRPAAAERFVSSPNAFRIEFDDGRYIVPDTSQSAFERRSQYTYDASTGVLKDVVNDLEYLDSGRGGFVGPDPETGDQIELTPGWRANVGFANFARIYTDPLVRGPFVRVFIWTVIYAFSSVALGFGAGLLVALLFNVPSMRGRRVYRAILIIPYAIPGFLSLLVWRGLLNQQWGLINNLLGVEWPWLEQPTLAKVSILLVNTWLGFPYFFLVATGALQAIPSELKEAASIDGASRRQIFRSVTLPLLLVATGPLLISSFAFNFNNFNQIYLLTGGGPALSGDRSIAGATDILISYTYKLAFAAGKGNDYALASTISIIIFFIIGTISFWSFRRSKALENMS
jgi:arabinogalactan oligomer / maltooligosaccharide transport system permease protein